MTAQKFFSIVKLSVTDFFEDDCMRAAASLSYYTVFALPPLLILILTILGVVTDPADVRSEITTQVERVVGPEGAEQVRTMIDSANKSSESWMAWVIGLGVLVFGATAVVVELQDALNRAWEVKPDPRHGGVRGFLMKRVISFAMIFAIAFMLLVSLVITALVAALSQQLSEGLGDATGPALRVLNFVVSFVIVTALFALMFKFLPDAKIRWRDVWVGGLITALLFVIGKFALGTYLGRTNLGSTYGAAGSLALILLWVYYSGLILFYGAEFTQAWAKRHHHRTEPEPGAVHAIQKEVLKDGPVVS